MAIQLSQQMTEGFRKYPIDDHGKFRQVFFTVPALTVAFAQNDQIDLCELPPGRKRILPCLSRISTSAWGSGRTIDVGHRAYTKRPTGAVDSAGDANYLEAEDGDALIDGMDVSAAVNAAAFSTALKFDIYSTTEVILFATILGGTMPIGGTLSGFVTYIYE